MYKLCTEQLKIIKYQNQKESLILNRILNWSGISKQTMQLASTRIKCKKILNKIKKINRYSYCDLNLQVTCEEMNDFINTIMFAKDKTTKKYKFFIKRINIF